jgi:hypothetical protein
MRSDSSFFVAVDPRAAQPLFCSQVQKNTIQKYLPLLLLIWVTFLLGFKLEVSPLGDEGGYHEGGVLLANSLANGTFLQDAFDKDLFKYPGYYSLAGVLYFVFGEHGLILRVFGLLPFLGLAVVVANTASLIAGERARNFAMLSVFFSPVFIRFSLVLYRDIYIVFALAVVLHAVIAFTQLNLSLRKLLSRHVLLAIALIYFVRTPQLGITLGISIVTLASCWSLSLSRRKKNIAILVVLLSGASTIYLSGDFLLRNMNEVFFVADDITISTTQLSAVSNFSFTSVEGMLDALTNPKFLVVTLSAKVSSLALGPHPFSYSEDGLSILTLFQNFDVKAWGDIAWEDVLLINGLQWIPHFIFLPLFIAGLIGIWQYNIKAMIALGCVWITYAILTTYSGNETRWGLVITVIYYLVTSVGYGMYGAKIKGAWASSGWLFFGVLLARAFGFPVPMLVVPVVLFGFMVAQKIRPIDRSTEQNTRFEAVVYAGQNPKPS